MPSLRLDIIRTKGALLLLFLFLLFFPKGGIKLGETPLTWGYLFLTIFSLNSFYKKNFSINKDRLASLALMLPFQILTFTSFIFLSTETYSKTLAFLVTFFCLPYIFFLFFSENIDKMEDSYFQKLLKTGVLFVSCYGIFLFFYKILTNNFLEIPLLTTNLSDFGKLDTKCIDRGFGFKLISTYNNGNLYGICLLMLLPLYSIYEKRLLPKFLVKASLLLTLSRTVWVGLFLYEFFYNLIIKKNKKAFFYKALIALASLSFIMYILSLYYDLPLSFFLDKSLGGRANYILKTFEEITFFPKNPFNDLKESVYPSILEQFGLIGLILFLTQLLSPFLVKLFYNRDFTLNDRAILLGLILYWILALSDGAMLLIPTMAFYWFLGSLFLKSLKQ